MRKIDINVGDIVWYVDGGVVHTAEVTQDYAGDLNICLKRACDTKSWYHKRDRVFKTKQEAVQFACKYCEEEINNNNQQINHLNRQNKMIQRQLSRLKKDLRKETK